MGEFLAAVGEFLAAMGEFLAALGGFLAAMGEFLAAGPCSVHRCLPREDPGGFLAAGPWCEPRCLPRAAPGGFLASLRGIPCIAAGNSSIPRARARARAPTHQRPKDPTTTNATNALQHFRTFRASARARAAWMPCPRAPMVFLRESQGSQGTHAAVRGFPSWIPPAGAVNARNSPR